MTGDKINNSAMTVIVVLILVLLFGGVGMMGVGGWGMGPGMMGGFAGNPGMMSGFGPFAAILSLVFQVLMVGGIVLLAVWVIRNANRGGSSSASGESPMDILKTRYARGEITKEQFDAIKRDLG